MVPKLKLYSQKEEGIRTVYVSGREGGVGWESETGEWGGRVGWESETGEWDGRVGRESGTGEWGGRVGRESGVGEWGGRVGWESGMGEWVVLTLSCSEESSKNICVSSNRLGQDL